MSITLAVCKVNTAMVRIRFGMLFDLAGFHRAITIGEILIVVVFYQAITINNNTCGIGREIGTIPQSTPISTAPSRIPISEVTGTHISDIIATFLISSNTLCAF